MGGTACKKLKKPGLKGRALQEARKEIVGSKITKVAGVMGRNKKKNLQHSIIFCNLAKKAQGSGNH